MSGFFPVGGGGGGGLGSPLVSAVLGAPASSISVSGIPATSGGVSLRSLLVIYGRCQGTVAATTVVINLLINGDSTVGHYGQGTGPGSIAPGFGSPGFQLIAPGASIAEPGGGWFYIFDYLDTSFFPVYTGQCCGRIALAGTAADYMNPNTWNGNTQFVGPVTTIQMTAASGNFNTGMYLEVFGIA